MPMLFTLSTAIRFVHKFVANNHSTINKMVDKKFQNFLQSVGCLQSIHKSDKNNIIEGRKKLLRYTFAHVYFSEIQNF